MDLLELLGERIKTRILAGGYDTVEQFAFENGISKSTLSEIINGKNNPKVTTLAKIASYLDITLSDLLKGQDIDLWVREESPGYNPKTSKPKSGKNHKKPR